MVHPLHTLIPALLLALALLLAPTACFTLPRRPPTTCSTALDGNGNTFGKVFRITTFGESHGGGVGVVVDGCPPRLSITEEEVQEEVGVFPAGKCEERR